MHEIRIQSGDVETIRLTDDLSDRNGSPFRIAVMIPVDLDPSRRGEWIVIPGKGRLWHVTLIAEGALALSPYYDLFQIPEGGELYVYSDLDTRILGAYTHLNNPDGLHFASELVMGSSITFEYFEPLGIQESLRMHLSDVAYVYRGLVETGDPEQRGFGDSGSCEVNIMCKEGNNWQDEKKGVVRILVRNGSSLFWCNGSVINNTRQDFEPYVLTADHCAFYSGNYASASDLAQWIFYFNYESETCTDPPAEPLHTTLVGATLKAQGGDSGDSGSDFYLVVLNSKIPSTYDPFFLGWDRENIPAQQGVTIHHPQGDIKKISTYTQPVVSSEWNNNGLESHWKMKWSETDNGFGVTEGGSSGAPLLDHRGLITGTLSGGTSSCSNTSGSDYFGKFSYSWESNGEAPSARLSPWLDPENTGTLQLQGTYYSNITSAAFKADTTRVPVTGKLDFVDLSTGKPTQWEWYFEGGEPSESDLQNPENIYYQAFGTFDVRLIIRNEVSADTLVRQDYIRVEPVISPNPSLGTFRLFYGNTDVSEDRIEIYNTMGMRVPFQIINQTNTTLSFDLQCHSSGTYLVRVLSDTFPYSSKIILIR